MTSPSARRLPRPALPTTRRGRLVAVASTVLVLLLIALGALATTGGTPATVHTTDQLVEVPAGPGSSERIGLDTTFFAPAGRNGPAPAVLLAHGFGDSKAGMRADAEALARHGYAVLTYSARGFGLSGGRIALDQPDYEVADAHALVDWLATRPQVLKDAPGDPRVGVAGQSYGGALALLAAAHDPRIDAVAPQITWWDLADALLPNATGAGPTQGVLKKTWAGLFFASTTLGVPDPTTVAADPAAAACGRFTVDACHAYQQLAATGQPTAATLDLLRRASPATVADRIKAPTLLVQAQQDSLFPLAQSDAAATALQRNGTPFRVAWIEGGHDGGNPQTAFVRHTVTDWFDRWLDHPPAPGNAHPGQGGPFQVTRPGGMDTSTGDRVLRVADTAHYPGLAGTTSTTLPVQGGPQNLVNPVGGQPPSVSSLPGLGALNGLGDAASLLGGTSTTPGGGSADATGSPGLSLDLPGQSAVFSTAPLHQEVHITGAPVIRLRVSGADDIVLFAKLYDVAPGGAQTLPYQLDAPLRITGARAGAEVSVRLPAIDRAVGAGHRLRLVLSSTDLAYTTPQVPAVYQVAAVSALTVPSVPQLHVPPDGYPWWTWALPAAALLVACALTVTARRRRRRGRPAQPDPALSTTPLLIRGLTKRYKGGRTAVADLSFTVERGQVLGLLGPNGAGKTTTLRMLMGLIHPDAGEIRIFGHAVVPGAAVLSRLGSFVEGPGSLPHLSGRDNLTLYWAATGRPADEARIDQALEIAGLGEALDRRVRTYSQGMRQRLAIAQAMLGLPDLLVLDEPTNGLDPPQIRAMREVLVRYAETGRTVVVSSHLLAEVEQTCTHVVVMHRGRLVAAGEVREITGDGSTLVVGTPVPQRAVEVLTDLAGVASAEASDDSAGPAVLVRLAGAQPSGIVAELVGAGVAVDRVTTRRRLEDAFLSLIGEQSMGEQSIGEQA